MGTLRDQLEDRFDPDRSIRRMLPLFRFGTSSPQGRAIFQAAGVEPEDFALLVGKYERTLEIVVQGIQSFAEHGWAPTSAAPVDAMQDALEVLASGDLSEAEIRLEAWWNREGTRLRRVGSRVRAVGVEHGRLREVCAARARLVDSAWQLHQLGHYEGSIPIVLAQVDGLTADVTGGRLFFTKRTSARAETVDDSTIAGLDHALPVVRTWFEQDVPETVVSGSVSRHGVMHGRELGYGTKLNSTKALVLMLAVAEWASAVLPPSDSSGGVDEGKSS